MRYISHERTPKKVTAKPTKFPWFWLVAGTAVTAIVYFAFFNTPSTPAGPVNFANDSSPVMYFYSDDCGACKMQKPVLTELAAEGFRVKLMNIGEHYEYIDEYGIELKPTFLAADGEKLTGFTQKLQLRTWLDEKGARIATAPAASATY